MSNYLTLTDLIIWLLTISLEAAIVALLIYRKHCKRYPVFTFYVGFALLKSVVLYYVAFHASYAAYYRVYWVGAAVKLLLLIGVSIEIFCDIFQPFCTLPSGKLNRIVWFVVSSVMAIIILATMNPLHYSHPLQRILNTFDRLATFIIVGIMWIVIWQSDLLGIPKTTCVYGICAGGLFFLLIDAAMTTIEPRFAHSAAPVFRHISMGAFLIAECVWLWYFRNPRPSVKPLTTAQIKHLQALVEQFHKLTPNNNELSTTSCGLTQRTRTGTL